MPVESVSSADIHEKSTGRDKTVPPLDGMHSQRSDTANTAATGRTTKMIVMIGAPVLAVIIAVAGFFAYRHFSSAQMVLTFGNARAEIEKLEIDGKVYDAKPQTISLTSGDHKVFVKARPGYKDDTSVYALTAGQKREIHISLESTRRAQQIPEDEGDSGVPGFRERNAACNPRGEDLKGYIQSITASSSTRDSAHNIEYVPDNLFDNIETTAWGVDLKRDPKPSFTVNFTQPVIITGIRVIPGYKKFAAVDRYLQNSKLRRVLVSYDRASVRDEFTFGLAATNRDVGWEFRPIDNRPVSGNVTVKILETYPGTVQGGRPASTDLCVSEFHFMGYPAERK